MTSVLQMKKDVDVRRCSGAGQTVLFIVTVPVGSVPCGSTEIVKKRHRTQRILNYKLYK